MRQWHREIWQGKAGAAALRISTALRDPSCVSLYRNVPYWPAGAAQPLFDNSLSIARRQVTCRRKAWLRHLRKAGGVDRDLPWFAPRAVPGGTTSVLKPS
jgi:hypothetical protein